MESKSQWLEHYFNITPDIVYFIDLEGRLQFWNAALEKLCGLPPSEMKGRSCIEFVCDEDKPVVVADVQKVFANGSHANIYRFTRSDGALIPFHCNGMVTYDVQGKPDGFIGLGRDISEQMLLEQQLFQQSQYSEDIINSLPDIFYMLNQQGQFARVNPKFFEVTGYSKDELDRMTALDFFEGEEKHIIAQRMQEVFENGDSWAEADFIIKSGKRIPYYFTGHRTFIEGHLYLVGLGTDVSQRKQIEDKLKESEFRLRYALEGARDGLWDWNVQTGEAQFSKRWKEMLGYSESEIGNKASEWSNRVHPEDMSHVMEVIQAHMDGKTPTAEIEFRMLNKDGSWRWILGRGSVVSRSIEGKPLRLIGTNTDINYRKQAEAAIAESMRMLEEKEQAKTRFLAAAGHDLRQPLAAANLFVDALKFTKLDHEQNLIVHRLEEAMSTFNELLDALLNMSKLDAGMVKPEFTLINVAELLDWVEQSMSPLAFAKHINFKLFFPMEILVVRGDLGLLRSVLMNLISNAVKFTSEGGILVSARRRGSKVLFQVWDTGIGIEENLIPKIFDEFYQIDNPQRDRTRGLGLGLSIAKRALAIFDGQINCRSRVGHGSVFGFLLPLEHSSSMALQQTTIKVSPEGTVNEAFARGKRFVVVEDDALVSEALTKSLEMMGGKVKCFHGAELALQHANIEGADYYIVDYMLGSTLNGIEFLNLLRQKLGKPIKAVLITGDTSTDFIRKTEQLEYPVLHKPVNISKLFASLNAQE